MHLIVEKLKAAYEHHEPRVETPEILFNCSADQLKYDQYCKVFNRKFRFKPRAIVLCETAEQISVAVKFTSKYALPLRVRSGGHDHEGECSGTDTILLDLSKMNQVKLMDGKRLASIQPGIRFKDLTTALAKEDVMIPHGTCATVCIAGFTMGGGWGPWTRKHGMCCESVEAATMVLANGEICVAREGGTEAERALLWAIKGGGGFSYGIVTEFVIRTFELPREMIRFSLEWNKYQLDPGSNLLGMALLTPTIRILETWENVIQDIEGDANQLVGTNLKISARPAVNNQPFNPNEVFNNCVMYGYWEGDEASLRYFIEKRFGHTGNYTVFTWPPAGRDHHDPEKGYGESLMSSWDRYSFHNVSLLLQGEEGTPFPPDYDKPAPHKITSRLVNPEGLGPDGHYKLLESLYSSLVFPENTKLGLFTYITLGAITGRYYQKEIDPAQKAQSAFPYKEKLYTIQYQTWWNETITEKLEGQNNMVYNNVNRALDWMDVCRDYDIPNTSGSFISFKDASVPTKTYFDKNYKTLVDIKTKFSEDKYNHFSTRKTII